MGGYHATLPARLTGPTMTERTASPPASPASLADEPVAGVHSPERLRRIGLTRSFTLVLTVALIALGLAWELWLAPLPGGTGALALKVLPLTLAITGLLRHRLYTYRWLSLLVWLYFTEGVVRATGDAGWSQRLAMLEIALSVLLFVACAVYVRLRLKVLPRKAEGAKNHDARSRHGAA
jgi:uncharacterized membrane protein